MSSIKKVSNKESDQGIIKIIADAYFKHYRRKGVCFLSEEVFLFLQRVAGHSLGNLLLTLGLEDKNIQGFLVGFPLRDYQEMTGIYNLSGHEILFSEDVFFIDSLIKLSVTDETNLSNAMLTVVPQYLYPLALFKRIIALIPDNPSGDDLELQKTLLWANYKQQAGTVCREESKFTVGGIRKISTNNNIFCLQI